MDVAVAVVVSVEVREGDAVSDVVGVALPDAEVDGEIVVVDDIDRDRVLEDVTEGVPLPCNLRIAKMSESSESAELANIRSLNKTKRLRWGLSSSSSCTSSRCIGENSGDGGK